jgi:urease accessory protein
VTPLEHQPLADTRRPLAAGSLAGRLVSIEPGSSQAITDAALLGALQLGDSLFPSGSFTLSHGLESLAASGLIRSAPELEAWIGSSLRQQVGPSDGVGAAAAWGTKATADLVAIDATLFGTKLAREPREASVRTGRQLLSVLTQIVGEPLLPFRVEVLAGRTPGTQPVVVGLAGRALGLDRRETVLLLLHQYVGGCLGAALRLIDLDDVEAQRVRYALTPAISTAAEAALTLPWEEMYACAPQTELMTMLHERSTVRLFAT